MIEGSCHCGRVKFSIDAEPKWLVDCNCSICRRIAALWGHLETRRVSIDAGHDATIAYIHGDRTLAMHTCRHCGCTTHWTSLDPDDRARMAVNFRMCADDDIAQFRVRHLDGADSWEYMD